MRRKVIVFFPHNPHPPRSGAHQRCLELLAALKAIGCEVTLLSSTMSSVTEWTAASIAALRADRVDDVRIYRTPVWLLRGRRSLAKLYWLMKRRSSVTPQVPIDSPWFSPPGMRRWFARLHDEIGPDAIVMSYAYWNGLLDSRRSERVLRVIDVIDLVSLNMQMQQALSQHLPVPLSIEAVSDRVLSEDFFGSLDLAAAQKEFTIYDQYDYTIAISAAEAEIIGWHTSRTNVVLVPMTQEPSEVANSYAGPALFAAGSNPFNIQGYLYFVKKVLPLVGRRLDSFSLHVVGTISDHIAHQAIQGVEVRGFVPDLPAVYAAARFAVCPTFGGTGQQVKITEAMAHGVPVIALRAAAERSPIRHGVNGLVADNAEEFAEHVVRLWGDQQLCRRLGQAARDTIAIEYSTSRLQEALSSLMTQGLDRTRG